MRIGIHWFITGQLLLSDGMQMTEGGGRGAENRVLRTAGRGQMMDDGWQMAEDRERIADDR